MCMFVYLCVCVFEYRYQKKPEMQDTLELEFQAVIRHLTWMLGTTFRSLK